MEDERDAREVDGHRDTPGPLARHQVGRADAPIGRSRGPTPDPTSFLGEEVPPRPAASPAVGPRHR